jgi:hypothetical protein
MRMSLVTGILVLGSAAGCTVNTDLPPDTQDPVVQITAPLDQAVVNGGVSIEVTAADNYSVEVVRILVDGDLKETFYTRPYHWVWSTFGLPNNIPHTIVAEADDLAHNTGRAQIIVTVFNTPNTPQ